MVTLEKPIKNVLRKEHIRLSWLDIVLIADLTLIFIQSILPLLAVSGSYEVVNFALIVFLTAIIFLNSSSFFTKTKNFAPFIVYLGFVTFPYLFGYEVIAHRYLSLSLIFIGYPIYNFLRYKNKLYIIKYSFVILMIVSFIMMISTYVGLITDPYLSRNMKNSLSFSLENVMRFIGGYEFIYLISSLIPLFFLLFLKKTKNIIRFFCLAFIVFAFLLVMKSGFLTAFLLAIVGVLLVYVFQIIKKKSFLKLFILVGASVLFITVLWPYLISVFPKRFSTVFVSDNFSDIMKSIFEEFTNDRVPTIISSVDAYNDSGWLGILITQKLEYDGANLYGFGQHSFVFDTFALYGLFGGCISLIYLVMPFIDLAKRDFFNVLPVAIVFILFLFINNATQSICLVYYILTPFFIDYYLQGDARGKQKNLNDIR